MRVKDPDGRTWRVGRRWLPWRRRIRDVPGPGWDLDFPDGDDPITAAIGLVFLVIGLVVALPAILVLIGLVLELSLLLALLPLVVAVRIALRRPWTVQVIDPARAVAHTERVVGWRDSSDRIDELAEQIRTSPSAVT